EQKDDLRREKPAQEGELAVAAEAARGTLAVAAPAGEADTPDAQRAERVAVRAAQVLGGQARVEVLAAARGHRDRHALDLKPVRALEHQQAAERDDEGGHSLFDDDE